tara:strand:- start:1364 stop:1801 length:438 start_codon:yes stop_codon:yes gene_type:complete
MNTQFSKNNPHPKVNIPISERPRCITPGCTRPGQHTGSYSVKTGLPRFRKTCTKCHSLNYGLNGWDYKQYRKDYCENIDGRLGHVCTTTIINPEWELDADHIDGNHANNAPENIQTLCACCHRVKTRQEGDGQTPSNQFANAITV